MSNLIFKLIVGIITFLVSNIIIYLFFRLFQNSWLPVNWTMKDGSIGACFTAAELITWAITAIIVCNTDKEDLRKNY